MKFFIQDISHEFEHNILGLVPCARAVAFEILIKSVNVKKRDERKAKTTTAHAKVRNNFTLKKCFDERNTKNQM